MVTVIEWAHEGFLFGNLAVTLGQAATGFLVGTLLGIMLGFFLQPTPVSTLSYSRLSQS